MLLPDYLIWYYLKENCNGELQEQYKHRSYKNSQMAGINATSSIVYTKCKCVKHSNNKGEGIKK